MPNDNNQISYYEADKQMKVLDAMLRRIAKLKKGKYRINTRGEPNRKVTWERKDKATDEKLECEIEVWLDGSNLGFNISGYVSYDDCDKAVRYWKLIKFNKLLSTLNDLNAETFIEYANEIDKVESKELEPATTLTNPYPFLKLKWVMKIMKILRGIFNF